MRCPGVYPPDPTLGITDPQMLPPPKLVARSRSYQHRPCPLCGKSCPRDRIFTRTLHDLGDPVGVAGLGRGQVGHVGGEEAAASSAVVLGIGEANVVGPSPHRISQVMQGAGEDPVAGAGLTAARAGAMLVVATARDEFRGREHLGIGDAQSGVRRVDCRTTHDDALPSQRISLLIWFF